MSEGPQTGSTDTGIPLVTVTPFWMTDVGVGVGVGVALGAAVTDVVGAAEGLTVGVTGALDAGAGE